MKKRFLGIICLLYSCIIIYVWVTNELKNFLAPSIQIYLKLSILPLLIMGLILLFNNKVSYKFKVSDLVLLLPIIMLVLSGDGRISLSLAQNRMINMNKNVKEKVNSDNDIEETVNNKVEELQVSYDFDSPDFIVEDANYQDLAIYFTTVSNATKYEGKTIRIKGFIVTKEAYIPKGYFAIGKYNVSCCTADAGFIGFIARYDKKVKDNTWYEVEGVLEHAKDNYGYDIMAVKVINIKEIDSKEEEEYVYPCYSYDDGSCKAVIKYDLEY